MAGTHLCSRYRCRNAPAVDDEREREHGWIRRHRHARRGIVVLHLESRRRDRSRASAGIVLPRHALHLRAEAHTQRDRARAARRNDDRPVQRGVRAPGPSLPRPGRLSPRGVPPALYRPGDARRPRDRELRRRSGLLLGRDRRRRRLRRPLRGQGRTSREAGQARRTQRRGVPRHLHLRAEHLHRGRHTSTSPANRGSRVRTFTTR